MKAAFLICCVLVVALSGLTCTPEDSPSISVTEDALSVSATLVENGVMIENAGDVDCLVFVSSPEGEQQFELAVGESVTVSDITKPIEVSAVSSATG